MLPHYFRPAAFCLHRKPPGHRNTRVLPCAAPCGYSRKNRSPHLFPVIVAALAVTLFWIQASPADEGLLRGPGKAVRTGTHVAEPPAGRQGVLEDIAAAPVLFYQHLLSPHWGQSCAYYPSCSNYALLAIRKHGAVIGTVIAFDRLQHEINEARTSPRILTGGQVKLYDPLENNDYWWYRKTRFEPLAPAGAGNGTTH